MAAPPTGPKRPARASLVSPSLNCLNVFTSSIASSFVTFKLDASLLTSFAVVIDVLPVVLKPVFNVAKDLSNASAFVMMSPKAVPTIERAKPKPPPSKPPATPPNAPPAAADGPCPNSSGKPPPMRALLIAPPTRPLPPLARVV